MDLGTHADGFDHLGVDEVVGDDLAELGEVPAEPFAQAHHVVVDLFVEVVEQRDGLDDHDVDFLGGELERVPGEPVSKSEGHLAELLFREALDESGELAANAAKELIGDLCGDTVESELFVKEFAELLVLDSDLVLDILGNDVFLEEFREFFGYFSLDEFAGDEQGLRGVPEALEGERSDAKVGRRCTVFWLVFHFGGNRRCSQFYSAPWCWPPERGQSQQVSL